MGIFDYVGSEVNALLDRLKWSVAIRVAIAGLLLGALVFGLVALDLWLATLVGHLYAPLIICAGFLVLAGGTAIAARIVQRARDRKEAERRKDSQSTLVTTGAITALPLLARSATLRKFGIPAAAIGAIFYALTRGRAGKPPEDD